MLVLGYIIRIRMNLFKIDLLDLYEIFLAKKLR